MSFSTWFTAARLKSLAALLPAIGSAVAIIIAATKSTGEETSSKGYDLLRTELADQREEMNKMNKSLIELEIWLKVLREHEVTSHEQQMKPEPIVGATRNSASSSKSSEASAVDASSLAVNVLPPVPVISPAPQSSGVPPASSVFKK